MPTVQLGDDDKTFKDVGEQVSTRNGYAAASGSAEIRRAPAPRTRANGSDVNSCRRQRALQKWADLIH
jgi:hypothetical protein